MKNIEEFIIEKLKINKDIEIVNYKIGQKINEEINGKKYNLVCCGENDGQFIFIIDDKLIRSDFRGQYSAIKNAYGEEAYPASLENLKEIYNNIKTINKSLENKLNGLFWTTEPHTSKQAKKFFMGVESFNYAGGGKESIADKINQLKICPLINI